MANKLDSTIFTTMQTGKPFKSYKKGIPAKVAVKVINPFSGEPEERILKGEKDTEDSTVDVWSEMEDMFLKRSNRKLFELGHLIEYKKSEEVEITEEQKLNQSSEEELMALLDSPWFTFKSALNKMTSEAPVNRMLLLAQDAEKSEKYIKALKQRLSEIQSRK